MGSGHDTHEVIRQSQLGSSFTNLIDTSCMATPGEDEKESKRRGKKRRKKKPCCHGANLRHLHKSFHLQFFASVVAHSPRHKSCRHYRGNHTATKTRVPQWTGLHPSTHPSTKPALCLAAGELVSRSSVDPSKFATATAAALRRSFPTKDRDRGPSPFTHQFSIMTRSKKKVKCSPRETSNGKKSAQTPARSSMSNQRRHRYLYLCLCLYNEWIGWINRGVSQRGRPGRPFQGTSGAWALLFPVPAVAQKKNYSPCRFFSFLKICTISQRGL